MKISELDDMEVADILEKLDLPPGFIAEYREWCEKQVKIPVKLDLVYGKNPLLDMLNKDNDTISGVSFSIPVVYNKDE